MKYERFPAKRLKTRGQTNENLGGFFRFPTNTTDHLRQPRTHQHPSPLPRSGCSPVLRAACGEGGLGVSPVRSERRRAQCWVTAKTVPNSSLPKGLRAATGGAHKMHSPANPV